MVDPSALRLAGSFLADEAEMVTRTIGTVEQPASWAMVVVGGAASGHLDAIARGLRGYVVIDPLAPPAPGPAAGEDDSSPRIVRRPFSKVTTTMIPRQSRLWLFTFNVYPYLEEPLLILRNLAVPGDIVLITSWGCGPRARATRRQYLRHVFADEAQRQHAASAFVDAAAITRDLQLARIAGEVRQERGTVAHAAIVRVSRIRVREVS
jgi:hypothetical protein